MPNKTTQILKEIENLVAGQDYLDELYFNARNGGQKGTQLESWTKEVWKKAVKAYIAQQQQEDYQWEKRFMELKKYLLFQERMVETHLAGRTEGDELILLETINEHVEEIEESEY